MMWTIDSSRLIERLDQSPPSSLAPAKVSWGRNRAKMTKTSRKGIGANKARVTSVSHCAHALGRLPPTRKLPNSRIEDLRGKSAYSPVRPQHATMRCHVQRPHLSPLANQYGSAACQLRFHTLLLVSQPGCEPQLLAGDWHVVVAEWTIGAQVRTSVLRLWESAANLVQRWHKVPC